MTDGHRVIIFGFSPQNLKTQGGGRGFQYGLGGGRGRERGEIRRGNAGGVPRELYRCFTARADALCELADAALCKRDRVRMLAELSLEPGHQRGHGALYDALNCGKVEVSRLRWALAGVPLPAWQDGRIRLAVDVSNWLRPDAATSPERVVLPLLRAGEQQRADDPGLAVLAGRRAGTRPQQSWTACWTRSVSVLMTTWPR